MHKCEGLKNLWGGRQLQIADAIHGWGGGRTIPVLSATFLAPDNPCIVEYQCVTDQIMGIMESQAFLVSGSGEAVLCAPVTSYSVTVRSAAIIA